MPDDNVPNAETEAPADEATADEQGDFEARAVSDAPDAADGPDAGPSEASADAAVAGVLDPSAELSGLERMLDLPLDVTVELGRSTMQLGEALALQPGSIIELERLPGEALDMHINERLVARGEVVVVNDSLGLRITEVIGREAQQTG